MVFENCSVKGPPDSSWNSRAHVGKVVLEAIKEKEPSKIILIDGKTGQEVTYEELKRISIKAAISLQKLGITKDDFVAMLAINNIGFIAAYLGALFVGCKIVFLNPGYTTGELHHSLSLCRPKLVLCSVKSVENLLKIKSELGDIQVLLIGDDGKTKEGLGTFRDIVDSISDDTVEHFRLPEVNPTEVVALFMSSGTTGVPKAVAVTHDYFVSMFTVGRHPEGLHFTDTETTLGYLPFFHILGAFVNLISVVVGTKLVLLEKFIPDLFLKAIQEHKVSKLFAVPPILLFLTKNPLVATFNLSSIRDIVCGAAPLPKEVENIVNETFNVTVRQAYATTEVHCCCIVPRGADKPGSVGNANVNFEVRVCDVDIRKALGPGQVGEICVKSYGMMKGYYGNEKETNASFDADGFYKTGDLGYYDEDGYFYVVDRLKEVIKCKGFQVAPAELEALLVKLPSVKDAGVIGIPDERCGEVPLAFVVKADGDVIEEDLVNYIAG